MKLALFLVGAAAVAGFAPLAWWPLVPVALAILFGALERAASPREAFRRGFAFGAGFFLAGVSWIYVSLHVFGLMPAPLAGIATVGFCLVLALFPALVGWLQARLGLPRALNLLLVLPALWTLAEWVRGWLFTGFPWIATGYSAVDTALAGLAPIAGVYGLSFALAMIAGAIALVPAASTPQRALAVLVAIAWFVAGGAAGRIEWTRARGAPIEVALLQGNIPQELKFVPGRYESIVNTYLKLLERAPARLTVLPETAIPRFIGDLEPELVRAFRAHGIANGGDVLVGLPTGDPRGRYYNSMVSFGTSPSGVYSKSHLVPFGEFMPPGFSWIVAILKIPLAEFTRGPQVQQPLAIAGERVAVNICYEDAFGEEIIRQLPEATLLVNASNVAWFGDSLAPAQHLQIARMRSIETGRAMLRATNTGVTAIIDHRGRTERLEGFSEGVLVGKVIGREGATPYVRFGNTGVLAIIASVLVIGLLLALMKSRRAPAR